MIRTAIGLLLLAGSVAALATPYWIDWEGDDWPENQVLQQNSWVESGGTSSAGSPRPPPWASFPSLWKTAA